MHNRLGYVPHTILSVISGEGTQESHTIQDPIFVNAAQQVLIRNHLLKRLGSSKSPNKFTNTS